jgi:hypothetical protein
MILARRGYAAWLCRGVNPLGLMPGNGVAMFSLSRIAWMQRHAEPSGRTLM